MHVDIGGMFLTKNKTFYWINEKRLKHKGEIESNMEHNKNNYRNSIKEKKKKKKIRTTKKHWAKKMLKTKRDLQT